MVKIFDLEGVISALKSIVQKLDKNNLSIQEELKFLENNWKDKTAELFFKSIQQASQKKDLAAMQSVAKNNYLKLKKFADSYFK